MSMTDTLPYQESVCAAYILRNYGALLVQGAHLHIFLEKSKFVLDNKMKAHNNLTIGGCQFII